MRMLLAVLLMFGGFVPALSAAEGLTDAQNKEAVEFVQNNARFVLYHEFSHLLIAQFDLPILGKEEDAADNIASVILLGERDEKYDNILFDAAGGWYLSDQSNTSDFEESDFYDGHSLDIQRFYQIVCLMAGQRVDAFGAFAAEYGLDKDRIDSCAADYEQLAQSWGVMNESFVAPNRGKGYTAKIAYDAPTKETELSAKIVKDSGMLEELQQRFAETLPEETSFRTTSCGDQNAFYDPETAEITICYELVDLFMDLAIENLSARDEKQN